MDRAGTSKVVFLINVLECDRVGAVECTGRKYGVIEVVFQVGMLTKEFAKVLGVAFGE